MKTALDWSAYQDVGMGDAYADIPRHGGDFAKAVAVCINSRQCEAETRKGVMCPSFRVTGDPALSTGGRVRLLKAALNAGSADAHPADAVQREASLLDAALADPTLARPMDLCVGCKRECEMAGTFGLEQEHADLSRQMAELALLPQLRANPSAPVIANGFSCRQQMRAHTAQRPRHLAQVLADALELDRETEPQQEVATQQAVEQNRATQNGRVWLRHHGVARAKQGRMGQVTDR
ncbi:hypothetical protein [Halochromatium salexigens]|uniref:hypothetical protein n=1 Tax=Halochromatium salexigens TaxID=49447 RepID=UPI001F5D7945|nr:hypothetical protein [Halochromatium salexigens]